MSRCAGIAKEYCNNLAQIGDHCYACGTVISAEAQHDAKYQSSLQSSYRMIAHHIRERARILRVEDARDVAHDYIPPTPPPTEPESVTTLDSADTDSPETDQPDPVLAAHVADCPICQLGVECLEALALATPDDESEEV